MSIEKNTFRAGLILTGLVMMIGGLTGLPANTVDIFAGTDCGVEELVANGSFETPQIQADTFAAVDQKSVDGWATTADDGLMELWSDGFSGVSAHTETQTAELNATGPSTLTQDLATPAPSTISWRLAHQGRDGTDTLSLSLTDHTGGNASVVELSASPGEWTIHEGTYDVLEGQSSTRLELSSVSVAGEPGSGNLIDSVSVTAGEPCVADGPLVAVDDSITLPDSSAVEFDLAANDQLPSNVNVVYSPQPLVPPQLSIVEISPDGIASILLGSAPNGMERLTYEVCTVQETVDEPQHCATATLVIDIYWENEPPRSDDDALADLTPGASFAVHVLDNDFDPDQIGLDPDTLRIVGGPSAGTAEVSDGYIIYTAPVVLFVPSDVMTYEVCDLGPDPACTQSNLTILLAPTPPPPGE